MKRTLKLALLASALIVLGMQAPSYAQQGNVQARSATSQRAAQPAQAPRYVATSDDDATADGYEAYAYAPQNLDLCGTQGSYGQGVDYSACGGGD